MKVRYATKHNTNGNSFQLEVDHASRTYSKGYFIFNGVPDFRVTMKEIFDMCENLENAGYIEI